MATTTPASNLLDRLPLSMRHTVVRSSGFKNICSTFVGGHVHGSLSKLISRLQEDEDDKFSDELEKLEPVLNYDAATSESDVCLVERDGEWGYFQWTDLDTIPFGGTSGQCIINIPKFASDNNLELSKWYWNSDLERAVHEDQLAELDMEPLPTSRTTQAFLESLSDEGKDFADVVEVLCDIAKHAGKKELVAKLKTEALERTFENYLLTDDPAAEFELGDVVQSIFHDKDEAMQEACETLNIDANGYQREIYEYWNVSQDLGRWLGERGEVVAADFMGSLVVWGRPTTKQSISVDGVITDIAEDICTAEIDALIRKQYPNLESNDESLAGVPINMLSALEQGRVRILEVTGLEAKKTWHDADTARKNLCVNYVLVLDPATSSLPPADQKAWVLDDQNRLTMGRKAEHTTKDEPLLLTEIAKKFSTTGDYLMEAPTASIKEMDAADVTALASKLGSFLEFNAKDKNYKVPENWKERLSALSPAYDAKLAGNDTPSVG